MNRKSPVPVLTADFQQKTAADSSGYQNHGILHGNPAWTEGYDGKNAIYITNPVGGKAVNYVVFPDLQGVDIARESYTVMLWYKTINGGNKEWASSALASEKGLGINMPAAPMGGIVFSNQNTADVSAPGMSAAQLTQRAYFAAGVTGIGGVHRDVDGIDEPQDSRWHQVTVVFDRTKEMIVYVDGSLTASSPISDFEDAALGENTLVLGADALGQYGLGNACISRFQVFAGVLDEAEIRGYYRIERLKALIAQIRQRLSAPGPEDGADERKEMLERAGKAKAKSDHYTLESSDEAVEEYERLKAAFERYLAAPAQDAALSMLLLSDMHISAAGDKGTEMLETVIRDVSELRMTLDGIVNPGDFAGKAAAKATDAAYGVMNELLAKYDHKDWQMIASFGNHEINYDGPEENYQVSTVRYWENLQAHISAGSDRVYGKGKLLETHYEPGKHFCYVMELNGYPFLVLNTDYLKQTGCSRDYVGPDGNWTIEGNQYDPIRHGVYFAEETFAWIEQILCRYEKEGRPFFVVCHFPFIDGVPLSYYHPVVIRDNSIGKQDARIRSLLAKYDNVVYISGHLHSALGMSGPVNVVSAEGTSFTEVNLPSLKTSARAYRNIPAGWIMFVYETEIVLRARDFKTGEWLTDYDAVIKLKK